MRDDLQPRHVNGSPGKAGDLCGASHARPAHDSNESQHQVLRKLHRFIILSCNHYRRTKQIYQGISNSRPTPCRIADTKHRQVDPSTPALLHLLQRLIQLTLQPRAEHIIQELCLLTLPIAAPVRQGFDKLSTLPQFLEHHLPSQALLVCLVELVESKLQRLHLDTES